MIVCTAFAIIESLLSPPFCKIKNSHFIMGVSPYNVRPCVVWARESSPAVYAVMSLLIPSSFLCSFDLDHVSLCALLRLPSPVGMHLYMHLSPSAQTNVCCPGKAAPQYPGGRVFNCRGMLLHPTEKDAPS